MLECGKNMKGTIPELCTECDVLDDESHRLNDCSKWVNLSDNREKVDFWNVYNDDTHTVNAVVDEIEKVWETRFANGRMKKQ